jgi:adenylate kinase
MSKTREVTRKKIIFIGAPGSGKGTYSSRLSPILGIPHIAIGDIFREEVKKGTALGKQVAEYMSRGELVPDEITIAVLKNRLSQADASKGFILDGYPRTIPQAEELEKITKIDVVLLLNIPDDILLEKLTARRVCGNCGAIYNVANIQRTINGVVYDLPAMGSKKDGVCDICGGELVQRKDDTAQVIQDRMDVYARQTKPLIEFYKKRRLIENVFVFAGPEEMLPKILDQLKASKNRRREESL